MKINTITCHDVYNAGASLQAYALSTYFKKIGHDTEIINYKPYYLSNHYPLFGVANPCFDKPFLREVYNVLKLPGRIKSRYSKRKKEFDAFTHEFLQMTNVCYQSNEQLKKDPPQADIYFAGSDQIWNCMFENGKDPAFYLDFSPDTAIKASYAASFAQDSLPEEWEAIIKERINRLDFVSVREQSGLQILKKLGIEHGVCVLDPVFLLEREHWKKITHEIQFEEPFVFLYDFEQNETLGKCVLSYAKKNGLKVYSFLPNHYCDRSYADYGPRMFLALIQNAAVVVSNSFHATAFSLIFEKEFWVVKRNEQLNARLVDLINMVGLSERMLKDNMELKEALIDYPQVSQKLQEYIDMSKDYINMVIEKANEK